MGTKCSICANAELAQLVNEMLFKKVPQADVAIQTGVTKSTMSRHFGSCFLRYKAERNRLRSGSSLNANTRVLVQWPDSSDFAYGNNVISANEVRSNDLILVVRYERLNVAKLGNPRGCAFDETTFQSFLEAALIEDKERAESKASQPSQFFG